MFSRLTSLSTIAPRLMNRAMSQAAETSTKAILVTGATGQVGSELVNHLRTVFGGREVVSSDVKAPEGQDLRPFHYLDVTNQDALTKIVVENNVGTIVHLASLLSATGEKNPQLALRINGVGFQNVMEVARAHNCMVFAPSTIAVFGRTTPRDHTPDNTVLQPSTMYGVTKVHLELLGEYYRTKYGVDFRSLRYPGLISYKAMPGGGSTDWAVEIFYEALKSNSYTCYVGEDTTLPMMYMPDALRATSLLMQAPRSALSRSVYNITSFSVSPAMLQSILSRQLPGFVMKCVPDFRDAIASSWPRSIDDSLATRDFSWSPEWGLDRTCGDMLEKVREKILRAKAHS